MKRFIKKVTKILTYTPGPIKQRKAAEANIERLKPLIKTRKLQTGIIQIRKKYRKKKSKLYWA